VVDYRGPELIRSLVEAMDIPIFHRVKQIRYNLKKPSKITIDRSVIDRLYELEEISVTKFRKQHVDETDIKAIESNVPPCRLAAVETSGNQINIKISFGNSFSCP